MSDKISKIKIQRELDDAHQIWDVKPSFKNLQILLDPLEKRLGEIMGAFTNFRFKMEDVGELCPK